MEIAKLGEFGLIDRLTKEIETKNESTKYGVGDDCAVLSYPDKEVLITTDLLMEGVHFDLTYIDLKHLGEYQRCVCDERHPPSDDGITGPEQAVLSRGYG